MPAHPVEHQDRREERRDHVVDVVVAQRVARDEERHRGERGADRRDAAHGERGGDREQQQRHPALALGVGRDEQEQLSRRLDEEGGGQQQVGAARVDGAKASEHPAEHRTARMRAHRPPT
jgi:hypothetical protein